MVHREEATPPGTPGPGHGDPRPEVKTGQGIPDPVEKGRMRACGVCSTACSAGAISGICFFVPFFGIASPFLAVVAIVAGVWGLARLLVLETRHGAEPPSSPLGRVARRRAKKSKGMAVTGLTLGILMLLVNLGWLILPA